MRSFGIYIMVFVGLSSILSFFDYEFVLLSWISTWGEATAWFIRAGLLLIGWGLLELENRQERAAVQRGPVS
ncbi:MAG: hypothetical protein QNJ81_13610 [Acidimicrobiia bacterium]|nr:hypothetical protein [Acidimicrobiia bacterium]